MIKRYYTFWTGCWKAFFKTKIGETKHWIQYYSVFSNQVWTEPKVQMEKQEENE